MDIKVLGMVGAGSMGGMMTLLFADHGIHVNFYDPSEETSNNLLKAAKSAGSENKISRQGDHKALYESLPSPRVIVFSLPHGSVGDETVKALKPYLAKGDTILDASNEHWRDTERRQRELELDGMHYIGMGVSGGYQAARHGPSMSPGGESDTINQLLPFLRKSAAKDAQGRPCVVNVGPRGSGHYVKMIHNGIEQGMMSVLCEIWGILSKSLSMTSEEIAGVFEKWSKDGLLKNNFLVSIGADICHTHDPKHPKHHELSKVKDKVVQDVDETEGTGAWSVSEGSRLHTAIPTIASAHFFRIASAFAARRATDSKKFHEGWKQEKITFEEVQKWQFLVALKDAACCAFLLTYIQGLHLISKASEAEKWSLDMKNLLQLWRGGCIIQSDGILDVLQKVYETPDVDEQNLFATAVMASELGKYASGLKTVVLKALEANAPVPALSATLEYYKYDSLVHLPTQFMEAELDYFGNHKFDLASDPPGKPVTGEHHFEWKPARGPKE